MTDEMKLVRNDLLTRRIRRVLRTFANGPRGYHHGGLPNVNWDDELIPKDLYPEEDLITAREERDIAKEQEEVMEKVRQREQRLFEESKVAKAAAKRKADAERVEKRLQKQKAEKKRKEEEEEERQRIEEERKKKEESDRKKKEEEEEKMRKEAEKRKEEDEEKMRKEAEKRKEEEEEQRRKEAETRKEEEEVQRRKEAERRKEEEEAKKEEERKREEEETKAKAVAEMEKKQEEEAIRKQEEEARKNEEAQGEMGDSGDIGTEEEGAGQQAAMGDRKGKGKQVVSDRQESQKPKKQGKKRPRKQLKSRAIIEDSDEHLADDASTTEEEGAGQRAEMGDRKGKGKQVVSDRQEPQKPKKQGKKRPRKEFQSSDEDLADDASTGEVSKKPRTTLDVAHSPPPACDRCQSGNIRCYPNGYRKACVGCRSAKQTCSHSKLKSPRSGLKPPKRQARPSASRISANLPPPPHVAVPPASYSHQVIQVKRKRAQNDEGEAGPSQILKVRIPPPAPAHHSSAHKVSPSAKGETRGKFIIFICYIGI
jgi:hypothetical protein